MREFSDLRATLMWEEDSADFYLNFQVEQNGIRSAEVATLKTSDPELQDKMRIMAQAFRMGQKFPRRRTP